MQLTIQVEYPSSEVEKERKRVRFDSTAIGSSTHHAHTGHQVHIYTNLIFHHVVYGLLFFGKLNAHPDAF